jgi:uncharacterized membrane protein YccC
VTPFDLIFIVVFLSSVGVTIAMAVAFVRGRRHDARRLARRLVMALGAYCIVVVVVSVRSPQRFSSLGENQCSDDWCIAADSVHRDTTNAAVTYTVNFRLSSRARRVAQRERFVVAYLRTGDGRRIDALPESADVPFDTLVQPEQTIRAIRRFVVSSAARDVGLVIAREGGFRFPGCCIIGDENSILHKRTIVRLE